MPLLRLRTCVLRGKPVRESRGLSIVVIPALPLPLPRVDDERLSRSESRIRWLSSKEEVVVGVGVAGIGISIEMPGILWGLLVLSGVVFVSSAVVQSSSSSRSNIR